MRRPHSAHRFLALLPLVAAALFASAPAAWSQEDGNKLVAAGVASSVATVHPGERFLLAVRFEIEPHWHIYWDNPGETGSATNITATGPQGFRIGDLLWPRPMDIPGMFTTYGYEDETIIFLPVVAPETLEDGTATFTLDVDWLVCKEACYLGEAALTIDVATSSQPRVAPDRDAMPRGVRSRLLRFDDPALEEAYRALPRPIARVRQAEVSREGEEITITGPTFDHETVSFLPNNSPGVRTEVVEKSIEGRRFRLILRASVDENNTQGRPPTVAGVINLGASRTDESIEISLPLREERRQRSRDAGGSRGADGGGDGDGGGGGV